MMCDDARLLLHAYLDDELDAAQSVAISRHMQICPACAASYADYAQLSEGIAQASLYRRAPAALRSQWPLARPVAPAAAQPVRMRRFSALAMAAGFAAALIMGTPLWFSLTQRSGGTDARVEEVISSHIRSLQPQHLMDVASTDQHTVKPWFAGKLDFSPRVQDLAAAGFPLLGGRLDVLDGRSVSALVYKRHLHLINLYQWPVASADAEPTATQWDGYTAVAWTAGHMRYVAVSDVSADELRQFARMFQGAAARPAAAKSSQS
jgi:anti-sigma factor RsiW